MIDLLPCPFCNSDHISQEYGIDGKPYVSCVDCGANLDGMAGAWNRRAPMTLAAALALPEITALVEAGNRWRAARTKFADDGSRRVLVGDEWQHLGQAESDMDTALRRIAEGGE